MSAQALLTPEAESVLNALGAWRELRDAAPDASISLTLESYATDSRMHVGSSLPHGITALHRCEGVTLTPYSREPGAFSVSATFRGVRVVSHVFAEDAPAYLAEFPVASSKEVAHA